ncbi:MAG: hypothetical protein ACUVQP_00610 [Bacteroidales bacterium]
MTKQEAVLKLLQSNNKEHILQGLDEFDANHYTVLLPDVISLYKNSQDAEIKSKIIFLLTNMKQNSAVDILVSSLNKIVKDIDLYPELIRSCWENGLDFSAHLAFFAEIFIRCSYFVALEAFTVIEGNIAKSSKEQIQEILYLLRNNKKNVHDDKIRLYEELIKVVESYF